MGAWGSWRKDLFGDNGGREGVSRAVMNLEEMACEIRRLKQENPDLTVLLN